MYILWRIYMSHELCIWFDKLHIYRYVYDPLLTYISWPIYMWVTNYVYDVTRGNSIHATINMYMDHYSHVFLDPYIYTSHELRTLRRVHHFKHYLMLQHTCNTPATHLQHTCNTYEYAYPFLAHVCFLCVAGVLQVCCRCVAGVWQCDAVCCSGESVSLGYTLHHSTPHLQHSCNTYEYVIWGGYGQ